MMIGALLRAVHFGVLYTIRSRAHPDAKTRMKAFWSIARLSCSKRPFELPEELQP
jgi:hypothetical protein